MVIYAGNPSTLVAKGSKLDWEIHEILFQNKQTKNKWNEKKENNEVKNKN